MWLVYREPDILSNVMFRQEGNICCWVVFFNCSNLWRSLASENHPSPFGGQCIKNREAERAAHVGEISGSA